MPRCHTHSRGVLTTDARISHHGSIFLFHLLTDRASEWVEEYVRDDRMMFGGALVVEHRYALDLAQGMVRDGLVVEYFRTPFGR